MSFVYSVGRRMYEMIEAMDSVSNKLNDRETAGTGSRFFLSYMYLCIRTRKLQDLATGTKIRNFGSVIRDNADS